MTHYVHPCKHGLVRIVKHGRRWRTLLDEQELARHDSVDKAVLALRERWPKARIPSSLLLWRELHAPRSVGHRRVPCHGANRRLAGAAQLHVVGG